MTTHSLPESVVTSFEELKRNARDSQDIATWFTQHLEFFGQLPPHKEGSVKVAVDFSLGTTSFLTSVDENYQYRCNVALRFESVALEESPMTTLVGMSPLENGRELSYSSSFKMPFDEWAYPVTDVIFDYMANDCYSMNITPEWAERSEKCINTYLPLHFPGLTLEKLKGFAALGLFPIDEKESTGVNYLQYDRAAFIDVLFNARHGNAELNKNVPSDMTV